MLRHRREIDGLRAWAILPVLAFHAGIPGFRGGFIGVDVFFVISGYLITGILLRDMSKGEFSIVRFLERRARRIIPALYFVTVACMVPAWFLMLADELENFGQSVVATAASCNNLLLWLTSGYWGLSSEFKPLLHTWSLSVEEQFYLVFPWVLLFAFRRGWVAPVIAVLAVASLVLAEWTVSRAPSTAFFMLHTRAFELLAGAWLSHREFRRAGDGGHDGGSGSGALTVLGLAMIAASCVLFDGSSRLPGLLSLVPIAGTMLVIRFAGEKVAGARLLCHPAIVGVGLISYSLYLWHQPLLAFLRLASAEPPPLWMSGAAVLAAVPLGLISWRFVERPFRQSGAWTQRQVFAITILGGLAIVGAGTWAVRARGFPARVPEHELIADSGGVRPGRAEYVDRVYSFKDAPFTDGSKPNVVVLGNSFARDFLNCVVENGAMSGCEISYVPVRFKEELSCKERIEDIPERYRNPLAQADVAIFVLGAFDTACWASDVKLYHALGAKRIIVVGLKNFGWNANAILVRSGKQRSEFRPVVIEEVRRQNDLDRARIVDAEFVDQLAMLMDQSGHVELLTPEGKLVSEDSTHLTPSGARHLGQMLFEHPSLRGLR